MQVTKSEATMLKEKEMVKMEDLPLEVKFPQDTKKDVEDIQEKEMEISPRILEPSQNQEETNMDQENEVENQEKKKDTQQSLNSGQDPETNTVLLGMPLKLDGKDNEALTAAIKFEGMNQPEESWTASDDIKYLFLEERLPDLTDEEFGEINKEDAIPINFLKRYDTTKRIVSIKI